MSAVTRPGIPSTLEGGIARISARRTQTTAGAASQPDLALFHTNDRQTDVLADHDLVAHAPRQDQTSFFSSMKVRKWLPLDATGGMALRVPNSGFVAIIILRPANRAEIVEEIMEKSSSQELMPSPN